MKSVIIPSPKVKKTLKAQIVEDGDIILQFDEKVFGDFVSNILSEKQLLERNYTGTIILTHSDLLEFYYLIQHKFKSQSNVFSDAVSARLYFNNGESHVLHGIEEIDKYNEPRNISPIKICLKWKCFVKDDEEKTIYSTSISVVIQKISKHPYGEISLAIQHNERLFANEIVQLLDPLIQRIIQQPTIFQKFYRGIKTTRLHLLWFPLVLIMSTLIMFSFYTYTPISGITKLSQKSIDLVNKSNILIEEYSNLKKNLRKDISLQQEKLEDLKLNIENPEIQFQRLFLKNQLVSTNAVNISLLLASYLEKIEIPENGHFEVGPYISFFRLFSTRKPVERVEVKNDKYILPDFFSFIDDKDSKSHFDVEELISIKKNNKKIIKSIEDLLKKGYLNKEYKKFLTPYLDELKNNFSAIDIPIEEVIRLSEKHDPVLFKIEKKILVLNKKLAEKPNYTITNFTKYLFIIIFFSVPVFILLRLLDKSKSFLALNSYTRELEVSRRRKLLTFKMGLFVTVIISVYCSLFANGVYDLLSYLF
jgi:hypothetical protein